MTAPSLLVYDNPWKSLRKFCAHDARVLRLRSHDAGTFENGEKCDGASRSHENASSNFATVRYIFHRFQNVPASCEHSLIQSYFEFLTTLITESALVKSRDMLSGWMCFISFIDFQSGKVVISMAITASCIM